MLGPRRSPPALRPSGAGAAWLGIALSALLPAACATESASDGSTTPMGSGGSAPMPELTVSFPQAPIELAPRAVAAVEVKVVPAGAYGVRLSLLGTNAGAAPDDAALDRGERISDPRGVAVFQLTAPSAPGTLLLRARVGDASADTEVTVVPDTTASVVVLPKYAGKRNVVEWIVKATVGTTCEALDPAAPSYSLRAKTGAPLRLDDVPVNPENPSMAITASAGALATGCATLEAPFTNVDNSVTVEVVNRPVELDTTALDLVLGLDAKDAAFTAELDAAADSLAIALRGETKSDVSALLDEIEAGLATTQTETFRVARTGGAWDTTLFERPRETLLTDALKRWQDSGRKLLLSPRAFEGRISAGSSAAVPAFALSRVGGAPAGDASLTTQPNSWSIDASDTLAFSATMYWYPESLLAALIAAPAASESGAADVPGALSAVARCGRAASTVAADSRSFVKAFTALCDAACFEFSCQEALVSLWSRAQKGVSAGDASEIVISGTGAAAVEERAGAVTVGTLTGSWAGRLKRGGQAAATGGPLSGYRPR